MSANSGAPKMGQGGAEAFSYAFNFIKKKKSKARLINLADF